VKGAKRSLHALTYPGVESPYIVLVPSHGAKLRARYPLLNRYFYGFLHNEEYEQGND